MINANEFRNKFIDFFKSKGHIEIPSASLIPQNDPTVLFNTAGMQPLVPYLMGQKHPLGTRLVNIQKCLRTVDFDNIGDNTHHTFFQMLGNWSLGDYFKKESISWSYEFLTSSQWLGIPKQKLAFTVYEGDSKIPRDEESAKLWLSQGVSEKRIAYLDASNNLWSAGDTGPCGPDTEIFYWTGKDKVPETFDPSDNRWVEIWNNVFMVFNRDFEGNIEELPKKNVDTGMGFERTLAILNAKESAYETDLFSSVIAFIEQLSQKKYLEHKKEMRIIADHIRSATFLIGDGCVPSNTERGYILRRLIRRAVRISNQLGITKNFTEQIANEFILIYKDWYPELQNNKSKIIDELNKEEVKFRNTLVQGLKYLEHNAEISLETHNKLGVKNQELIFSGRIAFLMFQSYGFPVELSQEYLNEFGLKSMGKEIKINMQEYTDEYKKHQNISKQGSEQMFKGGMSDTSNATIKLHTATHLLNEALRKIVSKDIKQKGSNITSERLRFDFNMPRALSQNEISAVEMEVNKIIAQGLEIKREEMDLDSAMKSGAQSEFGLKYPEKVSVYSIGNYSKEICMGPHVNNTKELGHFKIIKEESSASGIRRIKAILE
jgi:alanyl-tRNA synthetase